MDVLTVSERVKVAVQWEQPEGELWDSGIRIIINHFKDVKQVINNLHSHTFVSNIIIGQILK